MAEDESRSLGGWWRLETPDPVPQGRGGGEQVAGLASFVVLSRNRLEYTRRCLESVSMTRGSFEWVVVDNGSSDGTRGFLTDWAERCGHEVVLVSNDDDRGTARARNQGLAASRGEWIVFLDNDVVLDDPAWLEELIRAMRDGLPDCPPGTVAAASPLLLFPGPGDVVQCAGGAVTAAGRFGLLGRGQRADAAAHAWRRLAWAPTAALLVRHDALLGVGGFDESFDPVAVCEDLDLCCRLRAGGGEIVFVGSSSLRHFEGATFGGLGFDKLAYWRRHARVIKKRWLDVMTCGPVHTDADIVWRPLIKDYADLDQPTVRPATAAEAERQDLSFFASRATIEPAACPDIRVGVIGCGQVALRGALPGLSSPGSPLAAHAAPFLSFDGAPGVRVTAVCDTDSSRAQAAAGQFGVPVVAEDTGRLLDTVPLEAVVVCTPPRWHSRYLLAALERDLGVLVEKPGVVTHAELDAALAARGARPHLACMVNLPWAYHPCIDAVADLLDSAGPLTRAIVRFEHCGPEAWAPGVTWYRDDGRRSLVLDLGLHVLVVLERLLRAPVESLDVIMSPCASPDRSYANVCIAGTSADLEVGWDAPMPRFALELASLAATMTIEMIPWNPSTPSSIRVVPHGRWRGPPLTRDDSGQLWASTPGEPARGGPYRQFVDSVRNRDQSLTDLSAVANAMRWMIDWADVERDVDTRGLLRLNERSE